MLDAREDGYYESMGWKAGHVETTSRINVPAKNASLPAGSTARVSGFAFSGDRGISRVELSTDTGARPTSTTPQPVSVRGTSPEGATGHHTITVRFA